MVALIMAFKWGTVYLSSSSTRDRSSGFRWIRIATMSALTSVLSFLWSCFFMVAKKRELDSERTIACEEEEPTDFSRDRIWSSKNRDVIRSISSLSSFDRAGARLPIEVTCVFFLLNECKLFQLWFIYGVGPGSRRSLYVIRELGGFELFLWLVDFGFDQ